MSNDTPSGWTAIPHGLWTLPCSPRARVLLGWLWSHQDAYRDRLSVRAIARQIDANRKSITLWLAELEAGGMLTVIADKPGNPARVELDHDAWQSLHRRLTVRLSEGV